LGDPGPRQPAALFTTETPLGGARRFVC